MTPTPPLKMTQGGNDPLTPLHRLSTASLSGVVRCVAIATLIFRYFLRYFSSTSTEQIFPDSVGPFIVSIVFGFAIFATRPVETGHEAEFDWVRNGKPSKLSQRPSP
jgi:hypothetical protein